jgi:hypothetical protein
MLPLLHRVLIGELISPCFDSLCCKSNLVAMMDRYLIWIGSDQEKTFGPTIAGLIHNNLGPERVTLWDSKKRGARLPSKGCLSIIHHNYHRRTPRCHETRQGSVCLMAGRGRVHHVQLARKQRNDGGLQTSRDSSICRCHNEPFPSLFC